MEPSRFEFWRKWLIAANVMTLIVGLLTAFAGNSIFFATHNAGTRELFFAGQSLPPEVMALKNWLFGIIGGTIVGFHLLMIFICIHPFRERKRWSWQAMSFGLLSWFVIDSSVSAYYGAWYNLYLINFVALALIGIPLLATYRACDQ